MEEESRTLCYLNGRCGRAVLAGQVKVADLVIRRRAIPHPALGIAEEFPHGEFRVWDWILDHLPCPRVKAPNDVHVVGVIPEISVSIKTQRVRTGIRAGQWKFLKSLRLGVELQHLAAGVFSGIDHAVGPYFHPSRVRVR